MGSFQNFQDTVSLRKGRKGKEMKIEMEKKKKQRKTTSKLDSRGMNRQPQRIFSNETVGYYNGGYMSYVGSNSSSSQHQE